MANKARHVNYAVPLALAVDAIKQVQSIRAGEQEEFCWLELLGAGLLGYVGGTLVDVLEPASIGGSWHRKGLHSLSAGACLAAATFLPENKNTVGNRLLQVFAAAHLSHLFLDVRTSRGLPWFHPKLDRAIGLRALSFFR